MKYRLQRSRRWILGSAAVLMCVLPTGLVLRSPNMSDELKADFRFWYISVAGFLFAAFLGACIIYIVKWAEAKGWLE